MNNSTDSESFETGGTEQNHLFHPPESVSGSESEGNIIPQPHDVKILMGYRQTSGNDGAPESKHK